MIIMLLVVNEFDVIVVLMLCIECMMFVWFLMLVFGSFSLCWMLS